jgi:hypothetical protein
MKPDIISSRLNALLLGRLRMSTEEALRNYPVFAQAVFGKPKPKLKILAKGGSYTAYSATTMEREIKKIIVNSLKNESPPGTEEEPMRDNRPNSCRT